MSARLSTWQCSLDGANPQQLDACSRTTARHEYWRRLRLLGVQVPYARIKVDEVEPKEKNDHI